MIRLLSLLALCAACAHVPVQTSALPDFTHTAPKPILLASADVGSSVRDWYASKVLQQPYDPWSPTFFSITSIASSGSNGFKCTTNGCRVDLGSGPDDFWSSDGTNVTLGRALGTSANELIVNELGVSTNNGVFLNTGGTHRIYDDGTSPRINSSLSVDGNLTLNNAGNQLIVGTKVAVQNTAPTISSGFGTSPSIVSSTGSLSFQVNVGTGGVATSGVIGLPTATTGWTCSCQDLTTPGANLTRTTANSTTSCTVTNVAMSTGAAAAWTASDKLWCIAAPN